VWPDTVVTCPGTAATGVSGGAGGVVSIAAGGVVSAGKDAVGVGLADAVGLGEAVGVAEDCTDADADAVIEVVGDAASGAPSQ
jgi:hypothetical protein